MSFKVSDRAELTIDVCDAVHVTTEIMVTASDGVFQVTTTTYQRMNPTDSGRNDTFEGKQVKYSLTSPNDVHALVLVMLDDFSEGVPPPPPPHRIQCRLSLPHNAGVIKSKTVTSPFSMEDLTQFLFNAIVVVGNAQLISSTVVTQKGLLLH